MKHALIPLAVLGLASCNPPAPKADPASTKAAAAAAAPAKVDVPAGDYTLDKSHSSLIFRVDHLGFSKYTGRFSSFDAKLHFDPERPETSTIEVTVDPRSLGLENPPEGFLDTLRGPDWLDAGKFNAITFRSTKVEVTGPRSARITGDFTLHGVTKPLVLEATFNGGYAGHPMDPHARIGFSAKGALKRSDYGIAFGVPAPGSTMGVGDQVDIAIETEFTGPPLAKSGQD